MAETSKTADHALTVLLKLTDDGPLTPAELSRELGLNRTVVHRLLSTLHARGFVSRSGTGYVPGAIVLRIAERVQPELRVAAAGEMARLGQEIGETVVLHVADADDAIVLEQYVSGRHIVRVEHEIGSRHSLLKGASGRALLAFLPPQTIERVAGRAAAGTVGRQLESVRQLGYALSHDELQNGVQGLAVPVRHGSAVVASLAIIVPTTRANGVAEHVERLTAASTRITALLRGSAP